MGLRPDGAILKFRTGGGCVSLFGLPFFLIGLGTMTMPLYAQGPDGPPALFIVPFGSIFAAVGAGLVFGRKVITVDAMTRTASSWSGLLGVGLTTDYRLDRAEAVGIEQETRRTKNGSYTVYVVRIRRTGEAAVYLEETQEACAARQTGETVAKLLGLPLRDASTDVVVERAAGRLDESIGQRLKREDREVPVPDPPAQLRCSRSTVGGVEQFEIPAPGLSLIVLAVVAAGLLLALCVLSFVLFVTLSDSGLDRTTTLAIASAVLTVLFLLPASLLVAAVVGASLRRERVEASPKGLRVERLGPLFTKVEEIPADRLEELEVHGVRAIDPQQEAAAGFTAVMKILAVVAPGHVPAIRAVSDQATVRFGAGTPPAELRWMHALVLRAVSGR